MRRVKKAQPCGASPLHEVVSAFAKQMLGVASRSEVVWHLQKQMRGVRPTAVALSGSQKNKRMQSLI